MTKKSALITGITGQDGSYLAELLLDKGYDVYGMVRKTTNWDVMPNIQHIRHKLKLHYGDVTDSGNIMNVLLETQPDEVYNLAAQSHVHVSFALPSLTAEANAIGVLRMLDAIRTLNKKKNVKFYQASTSEMFGQVQEIPQKETTAFYPRSPYGVAKLFGHWITVNYRESYGLYGCSGILFNHESPRRGETFVTRKITLGVARVRAGLQPCVELGNIDALRDWGHAEDFVNGMWLMLQQEKADDYILSTGKQHSVREFCELVAQWHGMNLQWQGQGTDEIGVDLNTGNTIYKVNPEFYRPADVNTLLGDSTKARTQMGWNPKHTLATLVNDMCTQDWNNQNGK